MDSCMAEELPGLQAPLGHWPDLMEEEPGQWELRLHSASPSSQNIAWACPSRFVAAVYPSFSEDSDTFILS